MPNPARVSLLALVALSCSPGDIEEGGSTDASTVDAAPGTPDASAGDSGYGQDSNPAGDSASSPDAGSPADALAQPSLPVCVWNQAYQENYSADSVTDIVANAEGCYVLIDPFESTAARNAIPQMHAADNIVGCYISSGTCEDWRDDFDDMQPYCVSEPWGEWAGEYFVDMPTAGLVALMEARIDKMATWGCDMVEFDNMDWIFDDDYRQQYGFTATEDDGIVYNQTLCNYTHGKGMGCMAKNTRQGAESFDGGTFESYSDDLNWWTTAHLQGYLNEDKLGIIVHYDEQDCASVYADYQSTYGTELSFICESSSAHAYVHFN